MQYFTLQLGNHDISYTVLSDAPRVWWGQIGKKSVYISALLVEDTDDTSSGMQFFLSLTREPYVISIWALKSFSVILIYWPLHVGISWPLWSRGEITFKGALSQKFVSVVVLTWGSFNRSAGILLSASNCLKNNLKEPWLVGPYILNFLPYLTFWFSSWTQTYKADARDLESSMNTHYCEQVSITPFNALFWWSC